MKNTNLFCTLGAALLLAPATITLAQSTWKTVADIECTTPAAVDALTKDAAGNLYAAVFAADAQGRGHALIRKSSDQGATWTVVENFAPAARCSTRFVSLGADAAGHLYAVGYAEKENNPTRWIVRKSGKDGSSWSTVEDFAYPRGQETAAQGVAADAVGNLYVAGYGKESPSDGKTDRPLHWLVRQSRDGGQSWSTIDDFGYSFSARAAAIVSSGGGLFVAGSGWNGKPESGERWLVRRGTADGAGGFRWQTVDEFQMQERGHGFDSRARSLGVDGRGNLYAVGQSSVPVGDGTSMHWIVRRASSAGADWTVVDTFQLDPGSFAAAYGVAAGGQGGVYVVGQAANRKAEAHWIVRQSATGAPGSWSRSDDFRLLTPPPSAPQAAVLINDSAQRIMATSSGEYSRGLAIISDSACIYAGGSAYAGAGHGIVRKLEFGRTTEVTAARTP